MACSWLDEHPAEVVDALWGQGGATSPVWDHMSRCPECARLFDEMNQCLGVLQKLPWTNPPRLVYFPPSGPDGRRWTAWARVGLALALVLLTGGLVGQWVEHQQHQRQLQAAVQAALQQHAPRYQMACTAAIQEAVQGLERRFNQQYQALLSRIDERFDSYDTAILQIQGDINTLHRRQQYLFQDVQNKFQSILPATYRNQ
ncbi:hypothetical protein HRbin11_02393 [bacterium HR11]|nr:hypothetical protein HRbin11_02393 [bacterium HR11]